MADYFFLIVVGVIGLKVTPKPGTRSTAPVTLLHSPLLYLLRVKGTNLIHLNFTLSLIIYAHCLFS